MRDFRDSHQLYNYSQNGFVWQKPILADRLPALAPSTSPPASYAPVSEFSGMYLKGPDHTARDDLDFSFFYRCLSVFTVPIPGPAGSRRPVNRARKRVLDSIFWLPLVVTDCAEESFQSLPALPHVFRGLACQARRDLVAPEAAFASRNVVPGLARIIPDRLAPPKASGGGTPPAPAAGDGYATVTDRAFCFDVRTKRLATRCPESSGLYQRAAGDERIVSAVQPPVGRLAQGGPNHGVSVAYSCPASQGESSEIIQGCHIGGFEFRAPGVFWLAIRGWAERICETLEPCAGSRDSNADANGEQ
jgi:hypothetical protein